MQLGCIRALDFLVCYKEPRDYMPYTWRYYEHASREIMNRMWYLYELEVPLRVRHSQERCMVTSSLLCRERIKRWYVEDRRFRNLVNFMLDRIYTSQSITDDEVVNFIKKLSK